MCYKILTKTGLAALVSFFVLASGTTSADSPKADYTAMSAEELAEHLIFEAEGFDLDQKTQEGGTVRDRLTQDKIQKTCSALKDGDVDSATAKKVTEIARGNMVYPKAGIRLGDWKKGQALSQNAYGYRVGHKVDNHGKRSPGGLCMNCHLLDPAEAPRSGTLGPSLVGYGKTRGRSDATLKYTYEVVYNTHVAFPCTNMPRFGANGFLTQEQIRDVMAYLLDPDSPVNQ